MMLKLFVARAMANSSRRSDLLSAITNMTKINGVIPIILTKSFSFVVPEINLSLVVPINSTVMINECGDYILLQPMCNTYIFTGRITTKRTRCVYLLRQCVGLVHKVNLSHSSYSD